MVDINYIKSIIYPEQESVDKRIEPGDTLTDDIISILSNGKSENIKKCFKPLDKNLRGCKFHIITKCSIYCEECLKEGLEPYSDIVGIVWCVGWDNLAVWAKDTIKKLGKTKEDVLADVEATEKRFNDDMRKMEENRL